MPAVRQCDAVKLAALFNIQIKQEVNIFLRYLGFRLCEIKHIRIDLTGLHAALNCRSFQHDLVTGLSLYGYIGSCRILFCA